MQKNVFHLLAQELNLFMEVYFENKELEEMNCDEITQAAKNLQQIEQQYANAFKSMQEELDRVNGLKKNRCENPRVFLVQPLNSEIKTMFRFLSNDIKWLINEYGQYIDQCSNFLGLVNDERRHLTILNSFLHDEPFEFNKPMQLSLDAPEIKKLLKKESQLSSQYLSLISLDSKFIQLTNDSVDHKALLKTLGMDIVYHHYCIDQSVALISPFRKVMLTSMPKVLVELSKDFLKFLKNPRKFQISQKSLNRMENGSNIADKYDLDFTFSYPNEEWCGFGAYYDSGELVLHSFKANPEGKGVGTRGLKDLKQYLQSLTPPVGCRVIDIEDEAKEFWEKMSDRKLIDY